MKNLKEQADAKCKSDAGSRDGINGLLASIDGEIAAARVKKSPIVISSKSVQESRNLHPSLSRFANLPSDSRLRAAASSWRLATR